MFFLTQEAELYRDAISRFVFNREYEFKPALPDQLRADLEDHLSPRFTDALETLVNHHRIMMTDQGLKNPECYLSFLNTQDLWAVPVGYKQEFFELLTRQPTQDLIRDLAKEMYQGAEEGQSYPEIILELARDHGAGLVKFLYSDEELCSWFQEFRDYPLEVRDLLDAEKVKDMISRELDHVYLRESWDVVLIRIMD